MSGEPVGGSAPSTLPAGAPSWIDLLIAWIDRLPGDPWRFYLLGLLAAILAGHIAFWVDGAVPAGVFEFVLAANAFFVVYWLALYHYLTRVGSRSLQVFRPLLGVSDPELALIDHHLSILPRRIGWLALLLGLLFGFSELLPGIEPFGDLIPMTSIPLGLDVLTTVFLASTFWCLILRSIRQLRTVRSLHRQAVGINLLKLEPAHAFSLLTSRTGMGIVTVFIFGYLLQPSVFQTTLNIASLFVIAPIAAAVFVLPIIGIRDQIEQEKQHALDATSDMLQSARDDLHDKVRRRAYEEFRGIEDTIDALIQERRLLAGVSTWPWNPSTIRGFASALLLPVVLWLITRLLERFL